MSKTLTLQSAGGLWPTITREGLTVDAPCQICGTGANNATDYINDTKHYCSDCESIFGQKSPFAVYHREKVPTSFSWIKKRNHCGMPAWIVLRKADELKYDWSKCLYHWLLDNKEGNIDDDIIQLLQATSSAYQIDLEREGEAAINIQRKVRGNVGRRIARETRETERIQKAAIDVQRKVRGNVGRREVLDMRTELNTVAIQQGYENYMAKKEWEQTYSHNNFFTRDVYNGYGDEVTTVDQFSEEYTEGSHDVYNPPETSYNYYKSLLQVVSQCGTITGGGSATVYVTSLHSDVDDIISQRARCLQLDSSKVALLFMASRRQYEFANMDELTIANGISIFMFPGCVRQVDCISAPLPQVIRDLGTKPINYNILAYEGPQSNNDTWSNILHKEPLQWFQTLVFRLYIYNLGIVRHDIEYPPQEDRQDNWAVLEPTVGDLYIFILKLPTTCITYVCNVIKGVKFVKMIDIEASRGTMSFDILGSGTKELLEQLGDGYDEALPKSRILDKLGSKATFEDYCNGLEEVFMMAKTTPDKTPIIVPPMSENIHTFVVDADLLFNNKKSPPFGSFYSLNYTLDDLQFFTEYKSFIQILMLLNKYDGSLVEWSNQGLHILIDLLPDTIKEPMERMLVDREGFKYDSIKPLLPEFIQGYVNSCIGTSQFSDTNLPLHVPPHRGGRKRTRKRRKRMKTMKRTRKRSRKRTRKRTRRTRHH